MPKASSAKLDQNRVPLAHRRSARRSLVQAIYQWIVSGNDAEQVSQIVHEAAQGKLDWQFFDDVFLPLCKVSDELLAALEPYLDREISSLDPIEKSILLLGAFELTHRVDVPFRVVINESIELAKLFGATDSHKYVNGVLDKLAPAVREHEVAGKRS